MSYTASANHGAMTSAKTQTYVTPKAIDFASDFNVIQSGTNDITLVSNKSPLGREDRFRFAYADVANIYSSSGIEKASQSQLKTGAKIVIVGSCVHTFTDTDGNSYDKPIYGTVTMTIPKDPAETSTLVDDFVSYLMAGLSDFAKTGASGTPTESGRLWNMFRHVVSPSEIA